MKTNFFIIISLLFFGCSKSSKLEQALELSGDNRSELDKVLFHYKKNVNDSLKYKATCFLIENMPYHYSLESVEMRAFKEDLCSLYKDDLYLWKWDKYLENKYSNSLYIDQELQKSDIRNLSSEYIISNIDFSFFVWEKQAWGKQISFDRFCREILPFRVGSESIEEWRKEYYNTFQPILDSLLIDKTDYIEACQLLYDTISKEKWYFIKNRTNQDFGPLTLLRSRSGRCKEFAEFTTYVMRALAIPCGIDIIVNNPDAHYIRHYWNYITDNDGNNLEFELNLLGPKDDKSIIQRKRGKIYRICYESQMNNIFAQFPTAQVPPTLADPFLKDVSNLYFPNNKIDIYIRKNGDVNQPVYLCVFNNTEWIPIAYSTKKDNKVEFKNIEGGIVYVLGQYKWGELQILTSPFCIETFNTIKYIAADLQKKETIKIDRKYPIRDTIPLTKYSAQALGGIFQASNSIDFKDSKNLYVIKQKLGYRYFEVDVSNTGKYKYLRYLSPNNSNCNMAEIEFYDNKKELKGEIIGSDKPKEDNPQKSHSSVFDKDPLTYFESDETKDIWVGLSLEKPESIKKIRFLIRNDDNTIREGDLYELFYFSKDNNFTSLGKKYGNKKQLLIYENVPEKALLLLKNHTRGKQERIFTYENGRQIWW